MRQSLASKDVNMEVEGFTALQTVTRQRLVTTVQTAQKTSSNSSNIATPFSNCTQCREHRFLVSPLRDNIYMSYSDDLCQGMLMRDTSQNMAFFDASIIYIIYKGDVLFV